MFWAFLQIIDLIYFQRVGIFLLFFSFVWAYFLVKLAFARKYKPYTAPYHSTVSIVVPTYRENKEMLEKAMASMKMNLDQISEIIYAVDYRDRDSLAVVQSHMEEFGGKLSGFIVEQKGKRAAVAQGLERASGQIAIVMDSDTIMVDKNTVGELIKPFADPRVGGVVGNQRILIDDRKKIQKRIGDWIESMRSKLSYPAMSSQGTVGCLAGRCIAFRRSTVIPHLGEFLNEKFLGVRCETGDDRYITNVLLKSDYKTVYQSTSKVLTASPDSWTGFFKQQIRWLRSSRRETIMNAKWMVKKSFILPFVYFSDIVIPFFLAAVIAASVFGLDPTPAAANLHLDVIELIAMGLSGALLSIGLKQLPHLKISKGETVLLPLYALMIGLILPVLMFYALITMREQKWLTR